MPREDEFIDAVRGGNEDAVWKHVREDCFDVDFIYVWLDVALSLDEHPVAFILLSSYITLFSQEQRQELLLSVADSQNTKLIRCVFDHCIDVTNEVLRNAIDHSIPECVELCLKHGADPNWGNTNHICERQDATPLLYLANDDRIERRAEKASTLIRFGADTTVTYMFDPQWDAPEFQTPLDWAHEQGDVELENVFRECNMYRHF